MSVDLRLTGSRGYHPGRSYAWRTLWLVVEALVFLNPLMPLYAPKRWLLRLFGARIGKGVLIKPAVHIKYPWRLIIGDHSWVGERAWIDNMEDVVIGDHVVISQGAYLCTGNHDWSDPGMPLSPRPIRVERGAWVGAFAKVGPGVTVAAESVLVLGAVCARDTDPGIVYRGNPAEPIRVRHINPTPSPFSTTSGL
jgi:putative colanic acid biosynthesis acetyltransferase WcaF